MAVMEFANVSFRYPTSKEQVLKEVSFQVQKGDLVKTYDQKPDTDRDWERIDVFCGG